MDFMGMGVDTMVVLRATRLSKTYGIETIFKNASFEISLGERVALFGPNGSGKSTLLRIMTGHETPDDGQVWINPELRVGYVPQKPEFPESVTPISLCHAAICGLAGTGNAEEALSRFGISKEMRTRRVETLSAGEQTRLGLACMWAIRPDILLLDEPTCHLDIEGLELLTDLMLSHKGAALIVSHDRRFLDDVAMRLLELTPDGIRSFSGNYSAYRMQKEAEFDAQTKAYIHYKREERRLQGKVSQQMEWFRSAHRSAGQNDFLRAKAKKGARRAKATARRLERLRKEKVARPRVNDSPQMQMRQAEKTGVRMILAEGASKAFGSTLLFDRLDLAISRGDHLGIIGPNGCGKTTLLHILLGSEPLTAGTVWRSPSCRSFYMDQHYETLDPNLTVLEATMEAQLRGGAPCNDRGAQTQAAHDLLASLLIRGADVHKRISVLSWGERARVSIARMLISDYDLIALDEPTNNLDVESREAIELCLAEWKGTLVVVSHDRRFLEHTCNMIAAFDSGKVNIFPGTYSEWEEHRKRNAAQAIGPAEKPGHTVLELEHRLALLCARLSEGFQSDEEKAAIEKDFLATARVLSTMRRK